MNEQEVRERQRYDRHVEDARIGELQVIECEREWSHGGSLIYENRTAIVNTDTGVSIGTSEYNPAWRDCHSSSFRADCHWIRGSFVPIVSEPVIDESDDEYIPEGEFECGMALGAPPGVAVSHYCDHEECNPENR